VATTDATAAAAAAAASASEADRAATMLEKHRLKAPFTGTIQAREADVGDYLNVGQTAFEFVDVSRLRIVFQAGETEIASFTPGAGVEVTFPGLGGRTVGATVRHVAPAAGPNGLFRIEAELANAGQAIPGGLAAVVDAPVQLYKSTLFIPTAAVRLEGARAVVQRLRGNDQPELVTIEIGPEIEGRFPVFSGLNEGDRLVVR
jgi:RND family efflux transporter MFP subunit